jgi:hypothetical protein
MTDTTIVSMLLLLEFFAEPDVKSGDDEEGDNDANEDQIAHNEMSITPVR